DAPATGSSSRAGAKHDFKVLGLEVDDARALLELQDLFALEHLELTRAIYPQVTLRDWQLCLLCPLHILEKPNGRIEHVQSMVRK
ncbi:unnamed protein product, partial [Polarella glacialis]